MGAVTVCVCVFGDVRKKEERDEDDDDDAQEDEADSKTLERRTGNREDRRGFGG